MIPACQGCRPWSALLLPHVTSWRAKQLPDSVHFPICAPRRQSSSPSLAHLLASLTHLSQWNTEDLLSRMSSSATTYFLYITLKIRWFMFDCIYFESSNAGLLSVIIIHTAHYRDTGLTKYVNAQKNLHL